MCTKLHRRAGHNVKKFSSISDNQGYTKNTCTKSHDTVLNRYQEKNVHMQK